MARRGAGDGARGRISRIGDASWRVVEIAGGWAETSGRLSVEDRAELARLRKKASNPRTPLTGGDRAKYTSLVAKALGAERLEELVARRPRAIPASPREPSDLDAAARLERAARLRDSGVITEEDFLKLKARYLEEL
jgi:Short C-terminal domain